MLDLAQTGSLERGAEFLHNVTGGPMIALDTEVNFQALDACHQQIQQHLIALTKLAGQVQKSGIVPSVQAQAGEIEQFFSTTSRAHHLEEERKVFPTLIEGTNAELANAVRSLMQDHFWIEENWIALAPQLRAIAQGYSWPDETEFLHTAQVFLDLCNDHIALEESLIYPESKSRLAQALATRAQRRAAGNGESAVAV
jgi:iron-sulfur cluster repair protein YtfE (RIC family)